MPAALSLVLEIFGLPAVVALVSSVALTWLLLLIPQRDKFLSIALSWAVALSFVSGYALLPRDFAGFIPESGRAWKWLPYLALIAALSSSVFGASSRRSTSSVAVLVTAPIAAVLLSPTWPVWGLEPTASRWLLVTYLLLTGLTIYCLPQRCLKSAFLGLAVAASVMLAVGVGALVSARLAQLAAITSGALAGTVFTRRFIASPSNTNYASLISLYCMLVSGVAWIACVEPDPPKWPLLGIPLLPASLWTIVLLLWLGNLRTGNAATTRESA